MLTEWRGLNASITVRERKEEETYETMRDTRQVMNITDGKNLYGRQRLHKSARRVKSFRGDD